MAARAQLREKAEGFAAARDVVEIADVGENEMEVGFRNTKPQGHFGEEGIHGDLRDEASAIHVERVASEEARVIAVDAIAVHSAADDLIENPARSTNAAQVAPETETPEE